MSSRSKSRIFLSQFCFHRWALSVWLCGIVVVHWKFKPHHWHMWVNKYHSLWFLQVPYTRSQMHGGVNKRAWSGFHSWIEPINMHSGYHDSLRLVWLYSFFFIFLRNGLTDSDLLASTPKTRAEPNNLQKLEGNKIFAVQLYSENFF